MESILKDYARILQDCGDDLLNGDFQILPKLNRLTAEERRKTNIEMFGSESGEMLEE